MRGRRGTVIYVKKKGVSAQIRCGCDGRSLRKKMKTGVVEGVAWGIYVEQSGTKEVREVKGKGRKDRARTSNYMFAGGARKQTTLPFFLFLAPPKKSQERTIKQFALASFSSYFSNDGKRFLWTSHSSLNAQTSLYLSLSSGAELVAIRSWLWCKDISGSETHRSGSCAV